MIITITSIVILLLGIFLFVVFGNDYDWAEYGGIMLFTIGGIFLIGSILLIICSRVTIQKTIQENQIAYKGLCKRLEIVNSDYEDISKSDVIADITEWNTKVYRIKYWSYNPWVDWFNPKEIADNLEYISLEEGEHDGKDT